MQDSFDFDAAPDPGTGPRLDFERLDVYRVALEFQGLAARSRFPPAAVSCATSWIAQRSRSCSTPQKRCVHTTSGD